MCISDWDKKTGHYHGYIYRLIKRGLSEEDAIAKGLNTNG
jgi:hypothetical protein